MKKAIVFLLMLSTLSACEKDKLDRFSVVYEVEFVGEWNANDHPTDFPSNAHFSPFVACSHLSSYQLFTRGLNASEGLKDVAETGNTNKIDEELQLSINAGQVLDFIKGDRLDSPGNTAKFQLGMKEGYQNVTVVSMIAPSPDWIVATTTSLLDPVDGLWYDEAISYVVAYDAGTDSGTSFTSADLATDPVESISYIDDGPLTEGQDTVINMGYFKFTRIK
jgi:hypothetical protein